MATYSIWLCDPLGTRLALVENFLSLKYSRTVNDVGTLTLELPSDVNTSLIRIPDGRIEVLRNVDGREYLDTDTIWLIQAIDQKRDAAGKLTITVEAETPLRVVGEPGIFVNAFAGTANATMTGAADSLIVTIFFNETNAYFNIPYVPSAGGGATISKAFAWREVLKVMQEIAQASTAQGVYVAFDILSTPTGQLFFQTFLQQRGVDHRWPNGQNPVLLSPDFGNVGEGRMRLDYHDTASLISCGGAGQGTNRAFGVAEDTTLIGLSPFGWKRKFIELTNTADTTTLTNEAYAELRACRPRLTYTGKILDTPDTRYGVHWGWGDYVTVQDFGRSFDCRIEAVTVTVQPTQNYETVEAWLRSESYVVNL